MVVAVDVGVVRRVEVEAEAEEGGIDGSRIPLSTSPWPSHVRICICISIAAQDASNGSPVDGRG